MPNILISDINLLYPNSTKKLVLDLMETSPESRRKCIFLIVRNNLNIITKTNVHQIYVPFYKNKNLILRLFSEVYFNIRSSLIVARYFFGSEDAVRLAVISPSIFSFIPLLFSRLLRIKKRYLIQRDLYYNNISASKNPKHSYFVSKLFKWLFKLAIINASKVGFENEADLASVKKNFPKLTTNYEVLFNWYNRKNNNYNSKKSLNNKGLKIIYAGNLGIMQQPVEMIKSIEKTLSKSNLFFEFHIYGSGTELNSTLKEIKNCSTIFYKGQISESELIDKLYQYDFGVVSLDPTKILNNVPGKFLFYIDNYIPVLCVMNNQNFIKDLVQKKRLGIFLDESVTSEVLLNFKAKKMSHFYEEVDKFFTNLSPEKVHNKIWGAD